MTNKAIYDFGEIATSLKLLAMTILTDSSRAPFDVAQDFARNDAVPNYKTNWYGAGAIRIEDILSKGAGGNKRA